MKHSVGGRTKFYIARAILGAGTCALLLSMRAAPAAASTQISTTQQAVDRRPCIDILTYGGDRNGRADNAEAFRAAVAAANPQAICIYFPSGTYRFASSPAIALSSSPESRAAAVMIIGDGTALSRLRPDPDVDGLALHLRGPQQSFHIRDLSILATNKSNSAIGIAVRQDNARLPNPAQSDITSVSVHGSDGIGATNRFGRGILLDQISNVTLTNVSVVGSPDGKPYASDGICLETRGSPGAIPVQINVISSQFNDCGNGIEYGAYVQGVQILASNFVGNGTAIYQPPNVRGNDQLSIVSSQFNSGARNIYLQSPIDGVSIIGSDFYLSNQGLSSIDIPGVQFSIQGNCFIQLGNVHTTAITIGHYMLDAGVVTGNTFKNFDIAITLRPDSRNVNVQSNAYSNISTRAVLNKGISNVIGGGSP